MGCQYGAQLLYQFAWSLTHDRTVVEDIVQEVFVRAWHTQQRTPNQELMAGWFFQVAHNLCRDHFRRITRDHKLAERLQRQSLGGGRRLGPVVDAVRIQRTLGRLTRTGQVSLWLFYFGDWPLQNIAQALDITAGAVKSRLFRARKHFEQVWEEDKS